MGIRAPRIMRTPFARLFVLVLLLASGPPSCLGQGLHTPGPPASVLHTPAPPASVPAVDHRRTLRDFPTNLGRNLVGLFSEESLLPFAIGSPASAAAGVFDARSQDALVGSCVACGNAGRILGGATVVVPSVATLFVAGRLASSGRFRAATYDLAQAAVVNQAYTNLLKYAVRRERPDGTDRLSFPGPERCPRTARAGGAEPAARPPRPTE